MAGYYGYKMSNNAVDAYESGEKPLSKWSKTEIIKIVLENTDDLSENDLKKYNLKVLKDVFLRYSSWHHTSSWYNTTDFYEINIDFLEHEKSYIVEILNNLQNDYNRFKEEKKKSKNEIQEMKKVYFKYIEWTGSRNHPKANEIECFGIVYKNWIYHTKGKKSIKGNYVWISKEFKRAPKNTSEIFKRIEKNIKR